MTTRVTPNSQSQSANPSSRGGQRGAVDDLCWRRASPAQVRHPYAGRELGLPDIDRGNPLDDLFVVLDALHAQLAPTDVRRLLATLREKETTGHGGGLRKLSPRMVQFGHAVLRNALSNAVREELVVRNVAKMVKTSNPEYEVGGGLDPIAARALLAKISDDRLYALYLCAIVLGLRRGELLGLAWDSVDLDEGRLWVRQTLAWVDGRRRIQPPKTRASRRVIPLPDVVVAALRASRKRQDEERAEADERWTETGFVFTTRRGEPLSPYTLTKYWHEVRVRAGVPTLRFHDLRHTAVSLLLALGVPPHVVREIAGHSDIKVTMMVYAHGRLDEKAAALTQLGSAVAGTLPSTVAVTKPQDDQNGA